jgi:SSS family solute:Na+ symporter
MTIIVLVLYVAAMLFIGFQSFSKIKTFSDFFIAGNKGTVLTITGSLVATILGGSAIIGTIDEGSTYGWAASWFMLCAALGLLGLLPLVPKIKRLGKFTLPDLLGDLYGKELKFISSLVIPVAWLGITAAQVIASAKILQSFTGMDYQTGVFLSSLVFVLYTIAGGQISVLKTDFVQAIFVLVSLLLIGTFAASHPQEGVINPNHLGFPFNANFGAFDLFVLIITFSLTFTAGPDIYSRIFSANSESTAKKSVLLTALILIPTALIIGYLSVYGSELGYSAKDGSVIIQMSKTILPNWIVPVMVIGLISAVLSSADTTLLSASIIIVDLLDKSNFNNRSIVKTRITIFIFGTISMIISSYYTSIIGMLLFALTIYSGAFITPILLGLCGLKSKSRFAAVAVVLGGTVALIGKLVSVSGNTKTGNTLIITAFLINGIILLIGREKKSVVANRLLCIKNAVQKRTAFTPKT